jgi:hypothetical protein
MMLDAYDNPPGLTDEECDDLMDPIWDLLWRLSFQPPEDEVRSIVETGLADIAELEVRLQSPLPNEETEVPAAECKPREVDD